MQLFCAGKRRYEDKRAAVSAINLHAKRHHGLRLRAYPCKDLRCLGWHVTSHTRDGLKLARDKKNYSTSKSYRRQEENSDYD